MSRSLLLACLFGFALSVSKPATARPVADLIVESVSDESDALPGGALHRVVADLMDDRGATRAVLVVKDGRLIAEQYAKGYGPTTVFPAYSMTKSLTSTIAGILSRQGKLDVNAVADVPEWRGEDDPRRAIKLADLLHMSSGIGSNEEVFDLNSDTMTMLFGSGRHDVAHHAADHPLKYQPGSYFYYSNSTTNVISGIIGRTIGNGEQGFREFVTRELFQPLNIRSAVLGFDAAGTFVGSTYSAMTARDFARLGLLYARNGMSPKGRILAEDWVRFVSTPTSASAGEYAGQFWVGPTSRDSSVVAQWPRDAFSMRGFRGQIVLISPKQRLSIVILGNTTLVEGADDREYRDAQIAKICEALNSKQ
jgi:CubicO group peptidase (beta-lactamase class C family)